MSSNSQHAMLPRIDQGPDCPTTSDTLSIEQDFERDEHVDVDNLHEIVRDLRIDLPSPVNGLPTEIMAEIFTLVPTLTSECSDDLSKLRPWQSLRDVRGAVPLTSMHCGATLVGILGVPSRETITLLQRERLRVQELYFYAPRYTKSQNDVVIDLMALSLPKLKFCALTAYTYQRTSSSHLAFAGRDMRKLALGGSFVPQLCPSLTHLVLFNKISVSADELLDFLAGTPRLQYFRMHEIRTIPPARESVDPGEAAPPRQIFLPVLKTVLVTKAEELAHSTKQDYFAYTRHVFSQLSYPSGCDVSIGLIHQDDFLLLTDAFHRGKTVTSATLYKTTKSSLRYRFAACAINEQGANRAFRCEFNIEYSESSTVMAQSLITLVSSPELASLRRLWTTPRWMCKLLAANVPMRNLCTLIIHDLPSGSTRRLTIEDVARALQPNADGGVPCPAMKLLAVKCRVPRVHPRSDEPRDLTQLENTSNVLAIREAARLRMEAGYPLAFQILLCGSNVADVLHYAGHGQLSLHEKDHDRDSGGAKLRRVFFLHWCSGALEDWVNT